MAPDLIRTKGWRGRLATYLAATATVEFRPGAHDCALFAAGAVQAMTGVDPAAAWRGRYTTLVGGLRVIKRDGHGGMLDLVAGLLPATTSPRAGDIAVLRTPEGPALGIVQGPAGIYAAAPTGWALVPRDLAMEFFEVP